MSSGGGSAPPNAAVGELRKYGPLQLLHFMKIKLSSPQFYLTKSQLGPFRQRLN